MDYQVTAFTDTYLPTVNGVTYTLQTWRDRWNGNGGRMDLVYPQADGYDPTAGEYPVRSVPFPFYEGYRLGVPRVPAATPDPDLVHVHTPFSLGLAGLRHASTHDVPVVASYHTPAGEYAGYLAPTDWAKRGVRGLTETYERLFLDRAAVVIVPSESTLRHVTSQVGVAADVRVVSNGVDTDRFRPVDADSFRERHGLDDVDRLVGYTGRHGYEKRLDVLVSAAEGLDATVVFGGDGPARDDLEAQAADLDADVRFLGFLDRDELAAFYSSLDVFAFPSPVETQGLVALEANACGTPVVGVDAGALADTIHDGETGYHVPEDDPTALREGIERALANREQLSENCLDRREATSVDRSVEELEAIYRAVV